MSTATAIKPPTKTEQFDAYLRNELTKEQYDNMHILLGYQGRNRITRLLNPENDNLGDFNANEIAKLSEWLKVPAHDLIMEWGLGKNVVTLDEANQLVQSTGLMVGFLNHAA